MIGSASRDYALLIKHVFIATILVILSACSGDTGSSAEGDGSTLNDETPTDNVPADQPDSG